MTKKQIEEAGEARAELLKILSPGDTVYCVLRSVSRSGMSRVIDFYTIKDNEPRYITHLAAMACDYRLAMNGMKVSGCGMDMGFSVVYNLGHCLWPNGTDKPHGMRNGQPDSDGGYALKSQWI